ncbi:MAG: DUF4040 domain-containing protein [Thermoplasmata archaeon]|nr:DUF4040 domain-containing protein [Thermoplasmata archaeon]
MSWEVKKMISLFGIALIILSVFTIIPAIIAVVMKDLLACVIALAIMSLLLSLYFYLLHAPDVAIAEAGVGACITTALFIIAIRATQRYEVEK